VAIVLMISNYFDCDLRAQKIPARLGLAKVKNHIAVDQIVEKFGSDVLVPHGYIEIYLDNKWKSHTRF
jgi:hypothetical protein